MPVYQRLVSNARRGASSHDLTSALLCDFFAGSVNANSFLIWVLLHVHVRSFDVNVIIEHKSSITEIREIKNRRARRERPKYGNAFWTTHNHTKALRWSATRLSSSYQPRTGPPLSSLLDPCPLPFSISSEGPPALPAYARLRFLSHYGVHARRFASIPPSPRPAPPPPTRSPPSPGRYVRSAARPATPSTPPACVTHPPF